MSVMQSIPIAYYAWFPLVTTLPAIVYVVVFLRDAIKTRQKMLGYLSVLFTLYLVQHAVKIPQFYITTLPEAQIAFILTQVCQVFIILAVALVTDMFEKNTPYSSRQMLLSIYAAFIVGGLTFGPVLIVWPVDATYIVQLDPFSWVEMNLALFWVVTGVWLLVPLVVSYRAGTSYTQKTLIKGMLAGGIVTLFLGSIVPGIIEFTASRGWITFDTSRLALYAGIVQDIGLLVFGAAFLRVSKNPWLLQRQQVYFILVLSHQGVDLFSKVFNDEITPKDITLFSGGFSAITSLFQEVTKTATQVKSIVLEEYQLRLINRMNFVCAMLVDQASQAADTAHQKFTNEFEDLYGRVLQGEYDGQASIFEGANRIADKYFE